jgi:hypothetical protein
LISFYCMLLMSTSYSVCRSTKAVAAPGAQARRPAAQKVEHAPSRCRFICNPVVAGWRCMAAGWLLHAILQN